MIRGAAWIRIHQPPRIPHVLRAFRCQERDGRERVCCREPGLIYCEGDDTSPHDAKDEDGRGAVEEGDERVEYGRVGGEEEGEQEPGE